MIDRRQFTTMLIGAPLTGAIAPGLRLIAHRGGVVDETRPENSAAAVEEAMARGYWMVEVDVRQSRDGEPVLYHDEMLTRYFGQPRPVEELTWAELRQLRSTPGGKPPLHFEQLCELCGNKMRLMLDLKGRWEAPSCQRLWRYIEQAKVPGPTWALGGPRMWPLFDGKVMVSTNRKTLAAAVAAGEPVAARYFLFELGSELTSTDLELAGEHRVTPVAGINIFRYTLAKRDEWEGAKQDVGRLRQMGVTHYQIDSWYEPLFA
jgi:glycerophosphoryl diester phosphodiesterase